MIRTIYRGASLLISMVITLGLAGFHPQSVHAAVILDESITRPNITNTFSVAQEQPGDYLEPNNSYNDPYDGTPPHLYICDS